MLGAAANGTFVFMCANGKFTFVWNGLNPTHKLEAN